MSNMKRLMEEYPYLNQLQRNTWKGKLYPFRKITSMGVKSEEKPIPKGHVVVTFTRERWAQLPQDIREKIWDNSVSECYE